VKEKERKTNKKERERERKREKERGVRGAINQIELFQLKSLKKLKSIKFSFVENAKKIVTNFFSATTFSRMTFCIMTQNRTICKL
jgi:hypothetical protein